MERIDLFDKYIQDSLSDTQRSEFDQRLKTDADFASEFKVYLMTVDGICREARQNDMDFGKAMKGLTKNQLRDIIGSRNEDKSLTDLHNTKRKILHFKPWMWQAASIAAVVVIAFTAVFRIEQNSRNAVDNVIYACADINLDASRSGEAVVDITSMSDEQLKTVIPSLAKQYRQAQTTEEIADNGYAVAMAYLKLHDRDKAAEILTQLISRFEGNEEYASDVNKWKSILNLIK